MSGVNVIKVRISVKRIFSPYFCKMEKRSLDLGKLKYGKQRKYMLYGNTESYSHEKYKKWKNSVFTILQMFYNTEIL